MNHIYRLVWSRVANSWVAVAENACGKGKTKSRAGKLAVNLTVAALSATAASFSLPSLTYAADAANATVVGGVGAVSQNGSTTTINQNSQNMAIDWSSLSTAANEALVFHQPNASAIALNRITGSNPSEMLGSLTANGQVFILNPNGVLFGAGSQVNVGGLVASTMSLSNADFEAGNFNFSGSGSGSVINKGTLTAAAGGYLALLAPEVRNEGVMVATLGTALLAAGNKVTLNLDNGSLLGYSIDQGAINALAENKQLIQANGGQVLLSAKALDSLTTASVNNTGIIEAKTIQNKAGRILLMGDMEHGTVNVGGTLDASAPTTGNGGFIETSAAHVKVAAGTRVTTKASSGQTGQWLIDPNDFTIAATGGDMTAATVASNLANTNFEIATATMGTAGGNGDIHVNEALSWSSANTLTLTAQRNINLNQAITATSGGLVLNAGQGISAPAAVDVALFDLKAGTWRQVSGTLPTFAADDFRISGGTFIRALGGDGLSAGTAYRITDIYGLQGADSAGMLDKNYQLANNIDASGTSGWNNGAGFNPIGDSTPAHYFLGNLDGLGHTINKLTINRPTTDYVGLFGWIGDPAGVYLPTTISNVGLVGGSVTGRSFVGALAGSAYNGAIANSYASTTVVGSLTSGYSEDVGGLAGSAFGINITNSYATGSVTGSAKVGGLVGEFNMGRIFDSYASGNVAGEGRVGGLIGQYGSGYTGDTGAFGLVRSHATGKVSGDVAVGGLIGYTEIGNDDTLLNLYASGQVSGGSYVGGLIGWHSGGQLTNAYATGNVTATGDRVGGLIGQFDEYGLAGFIGIVSATGNVTGASQVGGLIGSVGYSSNNHPGSIVEAYAGGQVTGTSRVGGLVGELIAGDVRSSYSTGDVSGTDSVGGLVGYNQNLINGSYASGKVTGTGNVGGLVGSNPGIVLGSYWDITTTGQSGSAGGVGIANSAAYSQASYSGFDFTSTWYLKEGYTRPILFSERSATISNGHQLQLVDYNLQTSYTLANDIDMSELTRASGVWNTATGFVPLGNASTAFTGSFDGKNHTISNLFINRPTEDNVGLFGVTGATSSIRNVGLAGGSVTGNDSVGALAGRNQGNISNSYATADVTGTGDSTGGMVGSNLGSISKAYSTGTVDGDNYAGGLVGSNNGAISDSYSSGGVSANGTSGGLVARNSGTVVDSFWNEDTSNQTTSDGGTGITTAEMTQANTFSSAGWSASNVGGDGTTWRIYEGNTGPLLRSFLTAYNLAPIFDGSASTPGNIGAYSTAGADMSKLVGMVATSDMLTLTSGTAGNYTATSSTSGLYSHQQGYDLTSTRTIATPGSAAGDIKLGNDISFTDGALVMSAAGNIDLNGKAISGSNGFLLINGGTAINAGAVNVDSFLMLDGTWSQSASTLAAFAARDFSIMGGTFIRASGGDGASAATAYQLTDIYGLQGAGSAGMLGKYYKLANNIDASGTGGWNNSSGFNPIGDGTTNFTGTFDGMGYTITGLTIDRATTDHVGLFGATSASAAISNVGLVGGSVAGNSYVGGLIGRNQGSVNNTYATINVTGGSTGNSTGGLIGVNGDGNGDGNSGPNTGYADGSNGGAISNSYATGIVNGNHFVGGLIGQSNSGAITNSHATGNVTATGYYTGGLIGYSGNGSSTGGSSVSNSYATGNVTGMDSVGGLIGVSEVGAITNSYATGTVIVSGRYAGGLVGMINTNDPAMGVISNSYSIGDVRGDSTVGGLVGYNYGTIHNSYSTGDVTSSINNAGGLVGINQGIVSNAYSTGNVTGSDYIGGLVGFNFFSSISNSYSTGSVNGGSYTGGLVGFNQGSVNNSFWDTTTSGQATSAGGTGKTTVEMMQAATFAGWDIASAGGSAAVWRIYEGHTGPLLRSFLTARTLTDTVVTYDGATQTFTAADVLGSVNGRNAGTYSNGGFYSTQDGYDLSGGGLTINKANLTLAAVTDSKTYDGTTASTVAVVATGLVGADSATATQSFGNKNVLGAGVSTLSVDAGYTLNDGNSGGNYNVTVTAAAGTINKATLSVTGVVADNKTYDGSSAATLSSAGTLNGLVGGEALVLSQTGAAFADKNAGIGKTVTVTYGLADGAGGLAGNYQLAAAPVTVTADIGQLGVTVTATTANKTYDGTTASSTTLASSGVLAGDTVNFSGSALFADKDAGTAKTVTITGISAGGADANNYSFNTTAGSTADINKANLSIIANNDSRTPGGAAYAGGNGVSYSGFVAGESVSMLTGTLAYGGSSQGASTAGNYVITPGGYSADNYSIGYVNGVLSISSGGSAEAALGGPTLVMAYGSALQIVGRLGASTGDDSSSGDAAALAAAAAVAGDTGEDE